MKNLVPKSLAKQKGIFYKNIAWLDIGVILIEIALSCGITFGFIFLEWWIRILIAFSILFILVLLTIPYSKTNDVRMYKLWWYRIQFLIAPKKYYNTKDLNPYQQIKNKYIFTKQPKDGKAHYLTMVKIRGLDFSTLDETDAQIKLDQFHVFLTQLKKHFSIAKINQKYSLSFQVKYLKNILQKNKENYDHALISEKEFKTKKEQIQNQLHILENLDQELNSSSLQPNFYLVLYDINDEELAKTVLDCIHQLEAIGLFANEIKINDQINVIKNIFSPIEDNISNQTIEDNQLNLDKIFDFNSIEFKKDHLVINNQLLLSFQSISDYPIEIDYYWLSHIFLTTNANIIFNAKQIPQPTALNLINKAIVNSASNEFNEKKQVQKMQYATINEGFKQMAQDIVKQDQCVFKTNILILNYDVDHKDLIKTNRQIEKVFNAKSIKLNRLNYRQFEALNSFLPKINDSLINHIGREIPSRTLANGYPFLNNNLDDQHGMILGTNWLKEPIIFDPFVLNPNRKNHNMVILGSSGSGKSYLAKKMINWFAMTNKKVFILDVEKEYQNLTKIYDGNWIDIGSGTNGIINPLEIIISDDNLSTNDLILNHLLILESFFQILFPEISNQQLRYLINLIKNYYFENEYYKKNLSKLQAQDWPIFTNIYEYAQSKKNKIIKSYNNLDIQYIHELLRSELSTEGKLAFLYNKHSSININQKIACFDLNSLFEKNNQRIIQAQLFLSLNYIQKEVKDNDYTKDSLAIIIDEAHLLIDENNPIALDFVYQMVKRIRKRNGGIIIISQNPDDFMANESIAKKTKAILNNTQYSFFFNLSPNNVKDVTEMYKSYGSGISEDERLFIAKAKRGQALFFVSGFDRHKVDVFVSKDESKNF